jgi:5,10-methylenetetrahydromethanopterin reductase
MIPRFALNRFDARSVDAFAADVRRAETLGWDGAFQPDSQLRRRDTYVLLAAAARATTRITIGPLLANPVTRHPTVTASSIATIDELAPSRTMLGWGIGDTAVRLAGLRPARMAALEAATRLMRRLLDGEAVEVGGTMPARLPHHRPVPIWIAAGGPRTLRMAGGVADGVFVRVGTHPANISAAIAAVQAGAADAGRPPAAVRLGAVFHTVLVDQAESALHMARSIAAGYYEYSPALFHVPDLPWSGPDPDTLKRDRGVWPDFHHAPDLEASGRIVDFLPEGAADAFSLRGDAGAIASQLLGVLQAAPAAFDWIVLHPIPDPSYPDDADRGFLARVAREILPPVRSALTGASPIVSSRGGSSGLVR